MRADVVIVGGGIAGSALAAALAGGGLQVAVLERQMTFRDVVRGEGFVPWGVAELQRLGLHDVLTAVGHHTDRFVVYDPAIPVEAAEAGAVELSALVPDVPGVLNVRHAVACEALAGAAVAAGAVLHRGAEDVVVDGGAAPRATFSLGGERHVIDCRLVVGADGRNSSVRRRFGVEVQHVPATHLMTGLLVEGAAGWSARADALGTVGDENYISLPQGDGCVRLYVSHPLDSAARFAGPDGPQRLIDAFASGCIPDAPRLTGAVPAGPCSTFAAEDRWCPTPCCPGGVLVGDAAGYGDPIVGQGLSHAVRDVRLVRDALLGSGTWDGDRFGPYVAERQERLRRTRMIGRTMAALFADPVDGAHERRLNALARMQEDPALAGWLVALFAGQDAFPDDTFDQLVTERLLAA